MPAQIWSKSRIQGTFKSKQAAQTRADRVRADGWQARVVERSDGFKVLTGPKRKLRFHRAQ